MNIGTKQVSLDITDRMHAAVRDDRGKKLYTVIGPNHNRNGGIWTPCSAGVQSVTGDYRKAVADAEMPVRFGDGAWSLDIGGYRLRPKAIVGFDKLDDAVFSKTPIETFRGAPLEADGTMRCFGADAWLRMVPTIGGVEVRHGYAQRINERAGTAYYGTIWEVDDPAVIAMLQADTDEDCRFHVKGNLLLEYFSRGNFYKGATEQSNVTWPQWWDESLPLEQTEHKYTTKVGNLGSDETWVAGTYYLSGAVNTNTWNLTLDASGGDIFIKVGASQIWVNATGTGDVVQTANTSLTNRVYITSMNDDAHGETIAGSSGAPAAGDYYNGYVCAVNEAVLNLSYVECWYAQHTGAGAFVRYSQSAHKVNTTCTLDHCRLYYCGAVGTSYKNALIGQYRYNYDIGSYALSNIYIDSTCIGNSSSYAAAILMFGNAVTLTDSFIAPAGGTGFQVGVMAMAYGTTTSITFKNLYVQCNAANASGMAIGITTTTTGFTITASISQCIAYNTNTAAYGFRIYTSSGTVTATLRDCIALNASGVGGCGYYDNEVSGTLTDTRYNCGDWNCASRNGTSGAPAVTDNNPITANPSLGNLPVGCVIDTECVFPDGYAIGNLADYEMAGSQDFDTAAIDEATCSMTGYQYAGSDNVTPRCYYLLSAFPSSGPADGKVRFTDASSNTLDVDLPLYPYQTAIEYPFDIVKLEDGSYDAFDAGSSYDRRTCQCTFELSATEMGTWNTFFKEDDAATTKARGYTLTMQTASDSGWFPFGPDKGDAGSFTVAVIIRNQAGIGEAPYGYFHVDVDIVNAGSWPSYALPSEVSDGNWTVGTVTNVRFPPDWFKPNQEYRIYTTVTQNGTPKFIDRGESGDWWETAFTLISNESKMAAILAYLTATARAESFAIAPASGMYAFGYDKGTSGTYNVRLIQNALTLTHQRHNEYELPLSLSYISTAE